MYSAGLPFSKTTAKIPSSVKSGQIVRSTERKIISCKRKCTNSSQTTTPCKEENSFFTTSSKTCQTSLVQSPPIVSSVPVDKCAEMETFMYTFSIKFGVGFENTGKNGVVSPEFFTRRNGVAFGWKIEFRNQRGRQSLFLRLTSIYKECRFEEIEAKYCCNFVTSRKAISSNLKNSTKTDHFKVSSSFGWDEFSHLEFIESLPEELEEFQFFNDRCFKILCKISIFQKNFEINPPNSKEAGFQFSALKVKLENSPVPAFSATKLFDQVVGENPAKSLKNLCDIVLVSSDGRPFFCHKAILVNSSSVFENIFSQQNSGIAVDPEYSKPTVKIGDINSETLIEVLRYIYNKEFGENVDNLLENCLYAAEKYNVHELKDKCIATLKYQLDEKNVLVYLDLAEKFHSDSLKRGCFEILRLYDHVIDRSEVKSFFDEHHSVLLEMTYFLYKRVDFDLVM